MPANEEIVKEIIDVKEHLWLMNVKYLWLSLNISWALVFCNDKHVSTISRAFGINEERENMSVKQGIHKWS